MASRDVVVLDNDAGGHEPYMNTLECALGRPFRWPECKRCPAEMEEDD